MKPTKSLLIARDFPPMGGGMARHYGELCLRFPPGSVEVAAVSGPEYTAWDGAHPGLLVHRLPTTYRRSRTFLSVLRWAAWTRRRIARGDVEVLQVGSIRPNGYVGAWLRDRVPYLLYVHGLDLWKAQRLSRQSRLVRWSTRRILGGASAIVANSTATAELARAVLAEVGLEDGGRVRIVRPGTDPRRFRSDAPGAEAWREELGLAGKRVLLTVARLMPRKGIDTVMRTLPALAARYPSLVYLVAGAGKDLPRLEALARELGVTDRVRFLGRVEEDRLPGLYAAADVFVMPAREERGQDEIEGFGIVYCEAAASGLPCIAGDSGGVRDAVRDGETAFLVRPDVEGVEAALDRLVGDDALRRAMGEAARRSVEEYYNWDRAAAEAYAVVREVARGAGRS